MAAAEGRPARRWWWGRVGASSRRWRRRRPAADGRRRRASALRRSFFCVSMACFAAARSRSASAMSFSAARADRAPRGSGRSRRRRPGSRRLVREPARGAVVLGGSPASTVMLSCTRRPLISRREPCPTPKRRRRRCSAPRLLVQPPPRTRPVLERRGTWRPPRGSGLAHKRRRLASWPV